MATAAVTYTFTAGTAAAASEVNTNFTDIVSFLNNNVVHKDGSVSMSGLLTLSGNPSSGLQAAPKQYVDAHEVIEEKVLASAVSTTTFSSIPQTYETLQLYWTANSSGGAGSSWRDIELRFNGDTGNNYHEADSVHNVYNTNVSAMRLGFIPNQNSWGGTWPGAGEATIPGYTGTTFMKPVTSHYTSGFAAEIDSGVGGGIWVSVAAITSITLVCSANNFAIGSRFLLVGHGV